MNMAEDGTLKKVSELLEKEDAANEDLIAIWEAEEANSMMNMMKALVCNEPREYMSQNKTTLVSKVKATLKKAGKMLRKAKPRKKRATLYTYPIVASTLKFHKDDDVDPAGDAGLDVHAGAEQERDGDNYHECTTNQQQT